MALSNELISQFVKATKDDKKTKTETTVYGTTVKHNESLYVKLDGSDLLTPVSKTVDAESGERVAVMIKNHTATITGNLSSPSARTGTVTEINNKITDIEILAADRVTTEQLQAESARIDTLVTENVTIKKQLVANSADISEIEADNITINEKITAAEADITKLNTDKLSTTAADITYATIASLDALEADVRDLEATYGNFKDLTAEDLEAINATIKNLEATYATIEDLDVERGRIDNLETTYLTADHAVIKNLESDVADIDTLIFGSATGDTIQTSFSNAVIAQLGDAQIKSAMIESLSANKITAGDIITNNVRVKSEDGSLLISDETMQISDETRVRVQIGKDGSGDYSINIWDQNGALMFSKGGITDSAIKDAIIRNDMVSDTANIAAHKLDIDSLFEEINGSTNTIKSTQIYIDDQAQTLDVAFKEIETEISELGNTVSSQGTQLSIIQGEIESKVWQQDIDNATNEMSTRYSTLSQDLTGFKSTVSDTYVTKTDFNNLSIGGRNLALNSDTVMTTSNSMAKYTLSEYGKTMLVQGQSVAVSFDAYADAETTLDCYIRSNSGSISNLPISSIGTEKKRYTTVLTISNTEPQTITFRGNTSVTGYVKTTTYISNVKVELGNKSTDWTLAPEDVDTRITSAETRIEQNKNAIALRATTTELNNLNNKLTEKYYTSEKTEAQIKVFSDAISSTVSELTTQFENRKVGGRNLVPDSEKEVSFTNTVQSFDLTEYGISILKNTQAAISFDLYTDEPGAGCDYYLRYIDTDGQGKAVGITPINEVTDSYVRYSAVISVGDTAPTMFGIRTSEYTTAENQSGTATFYVRKIKVEIGNMSTDWTPAPEDMATAKDTDLAQNTAEAAQETATTAETLVQQLADNISMLVTDGNGTSLMTQTESGWTFSTAEIKASIASAAENLNSLNNEMNDTNHTVEVLQQAVTDLGEIAEYVKIGTFDNEPCIELGEGDSEFKLRITNTRILFMEGSSIVAHFTNQSLYIKKAVIEEELQQGEFVWKARSNGNLGLIWKGVNS